jgi:hypothetical protein
MSKEPVTKGIFIGRGLPKDAPPSFMGWGFSPIDGEGNLVDLDNLPAGTDPVSLKLGAPALLVGKQNYMPFWNKAALRDAVASENFAHPRMEEQINGWLSEGIESEKLYQKIKEAKGLLTLKDVGLEGEEKEVTPAQPQEEEEKEPTKSGG